MEVGRSGDVAPAWKELWTISEPENLKFRWGTTADGAHGGFWQVCTNLNAAVGNMQTKPAGVIAQGFVNSVPPPGGKHQFSIDFRSFLIPNAPGRTKDALTWYFVRILPIRRLALSSRAHQGAIAVGEASASVSIRLNRFTVDLGVKIHGYTTGNDDYDWERHEIRWKTTNHGNCDYHGRRLVRVYRVANGHRSLWSSRLVQQGLAPGESNIGGSQVDHETFLSSTWTIEVDPGDANPLNDKDSSACGPELFDAH